MVGDRKGPIARLASDLVPNILRVRRIRFARQLMRTVIFQLLAWHS